MNSRKPSICNWLRTACSISPTTWKNSVKPSRSVHVQSRNHIIVLTSQHISGQEGLELSCWGIFRRKTWSLMLKNGSFRHVCTWTFKQANAFLVFVMPVWVLCVGPGGGIWCGRCKGQRSHADPPARVAPPLQHLWQDQGCAALHLQPGRYSRCLLSFSSWQFPVCLQSLTLYYPFKKTMRG